MDDFYTIGKLSKAVNISTDTLRYYDEIGLLKPAHIDEFSGYRYYSLSQATELNRILELKAYGFSLAEIKKMPNSDTADFYRKRLSALLLEKLRLDRITEKLYTKINQMEQEEEKTMGKKILLVDDAAFMRMMCKDGFEKNGYEVVAEAENGEEAVQKYREQTPDIVIMDIAMPVMDGIQALRRIKEHDPIATVIMLSAMSPRAMVIESLQTGAKRFIAKPFNMAELLTATREAINDPTPFNPEALKLLSLREGGESGEVFLTQKSIDEITLIAKADTAKAREMCEQFTETYIESCGEASVEVKVIAKDDTHELLQKIASGQEEMLKLLKTIAERL